MLQHNEHHAAELDQMADNLAKMGMDAAAKTIKESVSDFQKGNIAPWPCPDSCERGNEIRRHYYVFSNCI